MPLNDKNALPAVVVSRRGAERLRAGHVWVYRSDVVQENGAGPGSLVRVVDDRKRLLGCGFYSSASQIALRLISDKAVADVDRLVRDRIRAAIAYRERFVHDTSAFRVIFSEGDFLPGLIVDKYNDILSVQVLTQAMDGDAMRQTVVSELVDALHPRAIVERVDARVRKLEQLAEKQTEVIFLASDDGSGEPSLHGKTEFQLNGVRFLYDAMAGQKTGAFLDHRENYAAAAQFARGDALDVFCYQGGFALHLAKTCDKVTGVDSSRPALEAAEQNAQLNGHEIEWIEGNAFDLLRDYSDAGQQYDCVVLDPPAFAKSKRDLETALRGYKELNLRALKMLRPGGILVTCSCSYHVGAAELMEAVAAAALDSHRIIRILENLGAAKDHPIVLGIPETSYLKCFILHVS